MRLNRRQLRRLIEATLKVDNEDQARKELIKTYKWFAGEVVDAIGADSWPIVAKDDYYLSGFDKSGKDNRHVRIISKGTKFDNIISKPSGAEVLAEINFPLPRLYDYFISEIKSGGYEKYVKIDSNISQLFKSLDS